MKKIFFLLSIAVPFASLSQEVSLGLKFTPTNQLQGIPLASTPFSGGELPTKVDLSQNMPPAGNQGHQQSCVAWSVAYGCKSYVEKLEENTSYFNGGSLNYNSVFSPAYIYNQINNHADGGSLISDALNTLSQRGAVKWSDMPYNENDYLSSPTSSQHNSASRYKIDFWRRVNHMDVREVKAQLNANYPVIFGAMIDAGFRDGGYGPSRQNFVWRSAAGAELGGHAMLVVGYDDSKNAFKVLNSWGTQWGDNGYCWIGYSHFPTVVREAYVFKDAINGPNSPTTPTVNPTQDIQTMFVLNIPTHNFNDPLLGQVMRFTGSIALPAGLGDNMQIVIKFYRNNGQNGKGSAVGSLSVPFRMPDGTAACGTPRIPVTNGISTTWFASMPYTTFDLPKGGAQNPQHTELIAEPVLYVNDFALQHGNLIPFFVNL